MKILVFEWLVGGGIAEEAKIPCSDPFLIQGASMYEAVLEDCLQLGAEVLSTLDPQYTQVIKNFDVLSRNANFRSTRVTAADDLEHALRSLALQADHVVLIAPESEGILSRCLQWLNKFESKLVCGPGSLIETCADKNATEQLLRSRGIPVAHGAALPQEILDGHEIETVNEFLLTSAALSWPLVLKPSRGAGGDGVFLCHDLDQLVFAIGISLESGERLRVEQYTAGTSVSVSIVRNPHQTLLLPATEQQFSHGWNQRRSVDRTPLTPQPIGHFVQSNYPLDHRFQDRAAALAMAVADAVPNYRGYLGVDMILADDGADVVVELNPRLTASYATVGPQTKFNLMKFLLST